MAISFIISLQFFIFLYLCSFITCHSLLPVSHSVVPKKVGSGVRSEGGRLPQPMCSIYSSGNLNYEYGEHELRLDEKSIEIGLEVQKCSVNGVFSGVVATTLIVTSW